MNIDENNELIFKNGILVTTSWTSMSGGLTDYFYYAYELFNNLLNKNQAETKLLIPTETLNIKRFSRNIAKDCLKDRYLNYKELEENIIYGKPKEIECDTMIMVDGLLPSKGNFKINKLIVILTNPEIWWTKNIKLFDVKTIELWYDKNIEFPLTGLIHWLTKIKPEAEVLLKGYNNPFIPDFKNYKYIPSTKESKYYTFLVWCPQTYNEIYSRDLFLFNRKYESDLIKEIKLCMRDAFPSIPKGKIPKLVIAGWNPTYSTEELINLNKQLDRKISEDRLLASEFASQLESYFNCEVEVYPECDLPFNKFLENMDAYIYTPSIKNWETSNRLLIETYYYKKKLCLPSTSNLIFPMNPGVKNIIEKYYLKNKNETNQN